MGMIHGFEGVMVLFMLCLIVYLLVNNDPPRRH